MRVNSISQESPKALIDFYRMHYENFFSIYGNFEDEIMIPTFEVESVGFLGSIFTLSFT